MNTTQELIIKALNNMRGDDTARARAAFRGYSHLQMQEKHGQSGMTRAEILAAYEEHDAKVDQAIAWVRRLHSS